MIKVKHLKKSFGTLQAVDDLSFEVKKGEIVGFLGPNGAGKTTTMRLLTGFLSADEGSIEIDGELIDSNLSQVQEKIGYLPENNPLYKDMLVSEMLGFTANLRKMDPQIRKEAFEFVVKAVSIDDVYYRPIGELSKGYKQRVGMALALIHKPKIIIMDEPTEGLDPNQRTEIRSLIKELAKDRTIILSTHVMQEAAALASRLLTISKGKLVADDTPDNLTQAKANEQIYEMEIEGKHVKSVLEKFSGNKQVVATKLKGQRYQVVMTTNAKDPLQPFLSKQVTEHDWVVWKLLERHNNLEEVFQSLTK